MAWYQREAKKAPGLGSRPGGLDSRCWGRLVVLGVLAKKGGVYNKYLMVRYLDGGGDGGERQILVRGYPFALFLGVCKKKAPFCQLFFFFGYLAILCVFKKSLDDFLPL